jgi:hypothetical protein
MQGVRIVSNTRDNNVSTLVLDYKGQRRKYDTTIDITNTYNAHEHLLKYEIKDLVQWVNEST